VLSTRRRRTVRSCDTTPCSKRHRLLFTGDVDEMFMTRNLNIMPQTTQQHLIVRSDKPAAYVTNNKRRRSTFSTIEAKLLTDRKHRVASLRQQSYLFSPPLKCLQFCAVIFHSACVLFVFLLSLLGTRFHRMSVNVASFWNHLKTTISALPSPHSDS